DGANQERLLVKSRLAPTDCHYFRGGALMMESQETHARVLSGILSNVKVKNTTADIFFRAGDREGIATTGVVAATMGLSGAAAGMVAMSMDEMKEPVCQVSFDIDGKHVEALLWNWPFKDGDHVQVVAEPAGTDFFTGFAVLEPDEKIIVLYPHVSAGGRAHWRNVIILSLLAGAVPTFIVLCVLVVIGEVIGIREPLNNAPQMRDTICSE
ncbi:putative type VI secretion system effector, partial [Xanthomonas oryzae]